MHWLSEAAARAGLKGAATLMIRPGSSGAEAWEHAARALSVTPTELAARVAPSVRLFPANFQHADPKALRLVPERVARKYGVFPLRDDDRQLTVATSDPTNLECEQQVAFAAGRRIAFQLAPPHLILQAIVASYTSSPTEMAGLSTLEAQLTDAVRILEDTSTEVVAPQEIEAGPVVRLTNLILRDATLQRASDVHIEPGDSSGAVRFRIDGVMRQYMQLPMAALTRVVGRIKVLGKLDIADRLRPQDGRARLQIDGQTYDLRLSTVPVRDSEKAVIRVLRPSASSSLDDAGLAEYERLRVRRLLAHREGIVLVTGPTGSGKTTTMYAALRELANGDVNIATVEDPVEYELPGIAQMQVDTKRGVTFASSLRAILRQDPDVIFVGEIRDLETAQIAVQAAMTGHLVLATLHTNDAVSTVSRLLDIGLDRASVAATLRGAIAQRLVRRICAECSVPVAATLTPDEARLSAKFGVRPIVRPVGCSRCANTGFFGRVSVNEVAIFSREVTELLTQGASLAALQGAAVAAGMRPLRAAAVERVTLGETALTELERVLGDADSDGGAMAARPSEETQRLSVEVPVPGADSMNDAAVLVVDDDPVQRLLVSATLKKSGFRVTEAENGARALARLTSGETYSLVLTDLHMPELDGDALIRCIRAQPAMAGLPIVVVTGSDDSDKEAELIDLGADDYVRKPIDPPRLIARVRAALRRAAV